MVFITFATTYRHWVAAPPTATVLDNTISPSSSTISPTPSQQSSSSPGPQKKEEDQLKTQRGMEGDLSAITIEFLWDDPPPIHTLLFTAESIFSTLMRTGHYDGQHRLKIDNNGIEIKAQMGTEAAARGSRGSGKLFSPLAEAISLESVEADEDATTLSTWLSRSLLTSFSTAVPPPSFTTARCYVWDDTGFRQGGADEANVNNNSTVPTSASEAPPVTPSEAAHFGVPSPIKDPAHRPLPPPPHNKHGGGVEEEEKEKEKDDGAGGRWVPLWSSAQLSHTARIFVVPQHAMVAPAAAASRCSHRFPRTFDASVGNSCLSSLRTRGKNGGGDDGAPDLDLSSPTHMRASRTVRRWEPDGVHSTATGLKLHYYRAVQTRMEEGEGEEGEGGRMGPGGAAISVGSFSPSSSAVQRFPLYVPSSVFATAAAAGGGGGEGMSKSPLAVYTAGDEAQRAREGLRTPALLGSAGTVPLLPPPPVTCFLCARVSCRGGAMMRVEAESGDEGNRTWGQEGRGAAVGGNNNNNNGNGNGNDNGGDDDDDGSSRTSALAARLADAMEWFQALYFEAYAPTAVEAAAKSARTPASASSPTTLSPTGWGEAAAGGRASRGRPAGFGKRSPVATSDSSTFLLSAAPPAPLDAYATAPARAACSCAGETRSLSYISHAVFRVLSALGEGEEGSDNGGDHDDDGEENGEDGDASAEGTAHHLSRGSGVGRPGGDGDDPGITLKNFYEAERKTIALRQENEAAGSDEKVCSSLSCAVGERGGRATRSLADRSHHRTSKGDEEGLEAVLQATTGFNFAALCETALRMEDRAAGGAGTQKGSDRGGAAAPGRGGRRILYARHWVPFALQHPLVMYVLYTELARPMLDLVDQPELQQDLWVELRRRRGGPRRWLREHAEKKVLLQALLHRLLRLWDSQRRCRLHHGPPERGDWSGSRRSVRFDLPSTKDDAETRETTTNEPQQMKPEEEEEDTVSGGDGRSCSLRSSFSSGAAFRCASCQIILQRSLHWLLRRYSLATPRSGDGAAAAAGIRRSHLRHRHHSDSCGGAPDCHTHSRSHHHHHRRPPPPPSCTQQRQGEKAERIASTISTPRRVMGDPHSSIPTAAEPTVRSGACPVLLPQPPAVGIPKGWRGRRHSRSGSRTNTPSGNTRAEGGSPSASSSSSSSFSASASSYRRGVRATGLPRGSSASRPRRPSYHTTSQILLEWLTQRTAAYGPTTTHAAYTRSASLIRDSIRALTRSTIISSVTPFHASRMGRSGVVRGQGAETIEERERDGYVQPTHHTMEHHMMDHTTYTYVQPTHHTMEHHMMVPPDHMIHHRE
eukprot:gene6982-4946_t